MKHQLKDTKVTHMEDLKRSITELWDIKMADSDYVYLKKLVKSMYIYENKYLILIICSFNGFLNEFYRRAA
jgi:hypothetical protein